MSGREKCIVDGFFGKSHPYGYCISTLDELRGDPERLKERSGKLNTAIMTANAGAALNLSKAVVSNPSRAMSQDCKNKLGNSYIKKTGIKCLNMNKFIHKHINNIITKNVLTGRDDPNCGILCGMVGSIANINPGGIVKAMVENPRKNCIEVTLPCHVVDSIDSNNNFSGMISKIPVSLEHYDELKRNRIITPTAEQERQRRELDGENFTNLHESIQKYLEDNNEYDNDIDDIDDNNDNNDEIIFNFYYLLLSIFLLFILFKFCKK